MKKNLRILHLEDDDLDAEIIKNILQEENIECSITRASCKKEYIFAIHQNDIDIIISDNALPDYDGISSLKYAKEHKPLIPFIFVSGTMGEERAIEALRNGARDYVLKQHLSKLAPAIQRVMHESEIERAAKANEIKYRSFFDSSMDAILLSSPDGKISEANPAACMMFGYAKEEIIKLSRSGIVDMTDPRLLILLSERKLTGRIQGEITFIKKDGTNFPAEVSSAIFKDQEGIESTSMIIRDITERKHAKDKIEMLAHSLRSINECVCITDLGNKFIFVNESFIKTYGYDEKELHGKHISIVRLPGSLPDLDKVVVPATLSGGWKGEIWNKRKDGSGFPIYLSTTFIKNTEGKPVGLIGVAIDITERKRIEIELIEAKEKAEEMNRLKSNFLANMSHELRTPLVGIIGFADILRQEIEDSEMKERAELIFNSGNRLSETLILLLELSRFETENMNFNYQQIDLVIESKIILSLFEDSAHKKRLFIRSSFSQPSIVINTNNQVIRSILSNLINNAIKFTKEGGIAVDISLKGNFVEIKVTDSGIGIAKNNYEMIFEEFRQVSEGLSRNFEGSGLGLHITKKLVEKFGGEIYVESELGKGSIFIVKLPVKGTEENDEEKTVIEKIPLTEVTAQKSVKPIALLVDDDPIVYPVLKVYTGGQVDLESTTDGESAIKLCRQKQYDLIFMDINLRRGMDGIQLTQSIRKIKGYEGIPIIATTAYAMVGDKEAFLNAGCSYYLSKPFSQQDILNLMKKISNGINN